MIRALARTPAPYATILASEIFSTGLILSDTDFRQFHEYGNLSGLDMALVQNSYLYHTRLDLPEFIEPGALQHMGENTLKLLEYLTSEETKMGNRKGAPKLESELRWFLKRTSIADDGDGEGEGHFSFAVLLICFCSLSLLLIPRSHSLL